MIILIPWSLIMVALLAAAGFVSQLMENIGNILFVIGIAIIGISGLAIHIYNIKKSSFGWTKVTGVLAIVSLCHTLLTIVFLKTALYWKMTFVRIIVLWLIYIVTIVANVIICFLTDRKRNSWMMPFLSIGVMVMVAVSGYAFYLREDKAHAEKEITEVRTYIVTENNAEVYSVDASSAYGMGDEVVDVCSKGEIVENVKGAILGNINVKKIKTSDGVEGYIDAWKIEPYDYVTRYQTQYDE